MVDVAKRMQLEQQQRRLTLKRTAGVCVSEWECTSARLAGCQGNRRRGNGLQRVSSFFRNDLSNSQHFHAQKKERSSFFTGRGETIHECELILSFFIAEWGLLLALSTSLSWTSSWLSPTPEFALNFILRAARRRRWRRRRRRVIRKRQRRERLRSIGELFRHCWQRKVQSIVY